MKKNLFFTILIILVILGVGFFLLTRPKNLEKFYKLTSEDPLFYSPFFDSVKWEKSIKVLKDTEDEFKKTSIQIYPKVLPNATMAEKNDYISTLQENDLFPYQFLENLILINKKTDEFLKNPSSELGKELLSLYDNAADSYIQNISSKIKILEDAKSSKKTAWPAYFSFIDSATNSEVIKNDFLIIKENGEKLKEEITQREKCLAGKGPCLTSPQDNKKIDAFIDSLNTKFDLKGEKIDFIKNSLPHKKEEIKGPYKIHSFCWQNPDYEQWMYLHFNKMGNLEEAQAKLVNQNYYWKIQSAPGLSVISDALVKMGVKFNFQLESTTYECPDLTFYPEILTLDFVKEQVKNGKIAIENLKKERDYRLLIENQFGLIAPAINTVSRQLKVLELSSLIDNSEITTEGLISIRSAYSIFYFPFAKSIWRINKQLQYFTPQEENPLMRSMILTLDDLEKLGYTETEITKFTITDTEPLLNSLLLQTEP